MEQAACHQPVTPRRSRSINTSVTEMLHLLHLLTSIWKIPGLYYLSEGIINISHRAVTWATCMTARKEPFLGFCIALLPYCDLPFSSLHVGPGTGLILD